MGIEDLKQRLANVPGIEKLTMRLEAGKEIYSVGGGFVAVDPMATDAEIEAAIRSVVPATAPKVTPLPIVNLSTEPTPAMPSASPIGFVPGEISGMFKALRERKAAMVAGLAANGADVAAMLTAGEQMAEALKAEGDAMRAEFGQITNFPPA
jgi:hypothetical protein